MENGDIGMEEMGEEELSEGYLAEEEGEMEVDEEQGESEVSSIVDNSDEDEEVPQLISAKVKGINHHRKVDSV